MGITVQSIYGGVTYQVKPFCGCVGLYAICRDKFGQYICTVPDYIYTDVNHMLADNFVEVK